MEVHRTWRAAVRALFMALAVALLASCGGGGGGGDDSPPPAQTVEGNWQLALTIDGQSTAGVAVPASAVPTQQQVSQITTANVAQVFASNAFSGYTVTVSGTTVTVTGPGTNYQLVVNSIAATNYQGCGACTVGAKVSYDVEMNYTESGTFDNQAVPVNTDSIKVTFTYTRVS